MKDIPRFLLDSANSGVYASPRVPAALKRAATACGLAWFDLDLTGVVDKASLLRRSQDVFTLPPSFGYNWDAFADCVQDLSWHAARGYVVRCSNGRELLEQAPADFETLVEILASAATYWKARNKLFFVLFKSPPGGGLELPDFPA